MLYLILARSGGGKTTHIINLISDFSKSGSEKLTLIVPEQFTFMSEKIMLGRVGAKAMSGIDVHSFTSLGEKLVGKPALHERRRLDDASGAVLMSMALESVRDKLCLYGKHTEKASVITGFRSLVSELKQNSVSSDAVRLAMASMENGLLKMKLSDIVTVLDAYDSMLEGSFFDPDDLLTELSDILPENDYFDNRIVFIDGFRGFTACEYKVIAHILRRAKAVYVTLCTDNLYNSDDETDLFAHTKRTAVRLKAIAAKESVSVIKPQYLSMGNKYNNFPPKFSRFASPELEALEKELFSPKPLKYEEECPNITLVKAADIYAECEYIACTAKKLIRENGFRCRDIAIIARDSSGYEAPLRSALKKCGVPVFDDSRQPIDASPVMNLVSAALNIAACGFDTESVMRCLKTELAGFSTEEISELENYCYMWQINGSGWTAEWTQSPSGFGAPSNKDADTEKLKHINSLREKIVLPLLELKRSLESASGEDAAKYIFRFLERLKASENLKALALSLAESGEAGIVIELERMWDLLMDLLDSFETAFRGRVIGAKTVSDTFELMLSVQTAGSLPQGLDEITIGSADRIRTVAPKAVFIAGANSGVFPAAPSGNSALTDNDRRRMSELGIELAGFGEYKLAEEKLIAYNAFCCASHKLYVCCPERNGKGEQLNPSELYIKIRELFPLCTETDASGLDGIYYVESKESAFELAASGKGTVSGASAMAYLEEEPAFSGRLDALKRAGEHKPFAIENEEASRKLFGDDIFISASRAESYHKCPFSYFCHYGIKAMPRKLAELDPMQRGNVIHHVLENLLSSNSPEELSEMTPEALLEEITALMDAYLAEYLDGDGRSERFLYLYKKLALSVRDVAQRLIRELSRSDFRPVDFELTIGADGEIPPYELSAPGGKISIGGAVDRVDTAIINGKKYLRVVDYKSSGKDFLLSDVVNGLNMQMFIYLFTLWQNGKERYGEITPAGVLYYPANSPLLSADRTESPEKIIDDKQKKCRMNGIVLSDCDVVLAMDREASGLFIPVDFKNGEMKGSLIGLEQLRKLKEKTDKILLKMAESLHSGKIEALPVYGKSYKEVCKYCDYATVCGHTGNMPYKILTDDKLEAVLAALEKGDEDDGN